MSKWVHIVGIAGVATSGIAVMLKNLGWNVTGSDKGFFPPVSDYLKQNQITILPGFKEERLTGSKGNHPDLIVYQGTLGDKNREIIEAKRLSLKLKTYPEILKEYVLKSDNSIVVTGSYGKTTITSALVNIFNENETPISYMFGAIPIDSAPNAKHKSDKTKYSIIEGDEYITSLNDTQSKFFKYSPKYLIINSLNWDHTDVFKTKAAYLNNFKRLAQTIPSNGFIVANANDNDISSVLKDVKCKTIFYSVEPKEATIKPNWILNKESKPLPTFMRFPDNTTAEIIPYEKKIIGDFNEENLLAAAVLAYELGVKKAYIQEAIAEFTGTKRRLEIKHETDDVMIIDDFGSSPAKASGALKAVHDDFPDSFIITVFEPNSGNRTTESLKLYKNQFNLADEIILPRFTRLPKQKIKHVDGKSLAILLSKQYDEVQYIHDDNDLINRIKKHIDNSSNQHTIVIFLGSHSFRGMIDSLISLVE